MNIAAVVKELLLLICWCAQGWASEALVEPDLLLGLRREGLGPSLGQALVLIWRQYEKV